MWEKHVDSAKGEHMLRAKTLLATIPSKLCHLKVNTESTESDFYGEEPAGERTGAPKGRLEGSQGLFCPLGVGTGSWEPHTLTLSLSLTSLWDVFGILSGLDRTGEFRKQCLDM